MSHTVLCQIRLQTSFQRLLFFLTWKLRRYYYKLVTARFLSGHVAELFNVTPLTPSRNTSGPFSVVWVELFGFFWNWYEIYVCANMFLYNGNARYCIFNTSLHMEGHPERMDMFQKLHLSNHCFLNKFVDVVLKTKNKVLWNNFLRFNICSIVRPWTHQAVCQLHLRCVGEYQTWQSQQQQRFFVLSGPSSGFYKCT